MISVMKAVVVFLVFGAGFTSCANFQKENSGAELRKEGYEALLKTVKPGMYRRQLYAVLPPCEKPKAKPPSLFGVAGVGLYWAHREKHQLDPECYLEVCYQLKKGDEYQKRKTPSLRGPKVSSRKPVALNPDSIDGLLSAQALVTQDFVEGEVPSKENPGDIIMSISGVHLASNPERKIFLELTPNPTQENGFIFGSKPEPFPLLPMESNPAEPRR